MQTITSFQQVSFRLLFLVAFFVAGVHTVAAQCPTNTFKNAVGECTFFSDEVTIKLKNTLILPSNTTLNCQSHRLVPDSEATLVQRSTPEVAIFLNGAQNVKIKNCTIEKFDFAIFAINSKRDPDNATPPIQLSHNIINAQFVAISFMAVDDSEIRNNNLGLRTKGGRAIYVGRDSDRNRILDNEITVTIPAGDNTQGFRVPSPQASPNVLPNPTLPSNPPVSEGSAVLIAQAEGPEPSLLNAFIGGQLFQLTLNDSVEPNGLFSEDNLFEGNIINIKDDSTKVDGLVISAAQRTRVSHNIITGGKSLIRVGFQTTTRPFPGRCVNSGRYCLLNPPGQEQHRDCNIPNFDTASNDTCEATTTRTVSWVSHNTIIQDNDIVWPFDVGIATTGQATIITGNTIKRRANRPVAATDPRSGIGIRLVGKFVLEGGSHPLFLTPTVVTRNTLTDIENALNLIQTIPGQPAATASGFNVNISLNDFIRYGTAVLLGLPPPPPSPPYDLSSKLFDQLTLKGNFWALPQLCPPGPGFDPRKVVHVLGPIQTLTPPLVNDLHPFAAPVANAPSPIPCR